MGVGAMCLSAISACTGGLAQLTLLSAPQWIASGYLAIVCGALIFFLWAFALGRTAPTLVAVSVAVNPVTAAILGMPLLGEPVSPNLVVGLLAVLVGIGIASAKVEWSDLLGRRYGNRSIDAGEARRARGDLRRRRGRQVTALPRISLQHDGKGKLDGT
jgi:hypothetical protein